MSFDRVWGQEQAVGFLRQALARGRLAHALIFVGPSGVGRRLTARELAKALLCLRADPEQGGCDECRACRQIDHGNHPGCFELARRSGKQVIEVERLREFLKPMRRRLASGERQIFVIDDAEQFGIEGYNTVLKRLEEPPPRNLVILVAQGLDSLPATVVSRAQVVRFHKLAPEVLERVLVERCGVAAETARRVLRLLRGSVEPVAEDLDAWVAERQWVAEAVGRLVPADVVAVCQGILERAAGGGEASVERNLKVVDLLRAALWLYRDAVVWQRTGEEGLLSGAAPADVVQELARRSDGRGLGKSLASLLRAQVELEKTNPALQLSDVLVELVRRRHERSISVGGC